MDSHYASTVIFCVLFSYLASTSKVVYSDKLIYQDGLKNYTQLNLTRVIGPESIAFDCKGVGPYVGVSDGRVLRWLGRKLGWTEFTIPTPNRDRKICDGSANPELEPVCGRPLGLKFNPTTCDLYIADAYYGLQVAGPKGGVAKQLAISAEGVPFRLTNALDIDNKTGVVYFTDSSINFQRREFVLAIVSNDKTGRLLKYDPRTKLVSVLYKNLALPNGIALGQDDNSFLLLAETGTRRILKFSLANSGKLPYPETFSQLGRFPDNIKRDAHGKFWVALNSARGRFQRLEYPSSQQDIEYSTKDPVAIKFSESGRVIKVLDGGGADTLDSVSEVEEHHGGLWVGSSLQPYVVHIRNNKQSNH